MPSSLICHLQNHQLSSSHTPHSKPSKMVKPSPSSSSSSSSSPFNPSTNTHQIPPVKPRLKRTRRARGANEPQSSPGQTKRSSIYRGVTKHRWTGRYEAHLWDKHCWNQMQNKKGKQVYLGAYDEEEAAAHNYDLAALKYWGPDTLLNFPLSTYEKEYEEMQSISREEYMASLRRRSSGFSRGASKYRGVAKHHHNGRWEARIGRVYGNKYLYLGTFNTQEEAARAYDLAALEYRGPTAVTNFDSSLYTNRAPQIQNQIPNQHQQQISADQPPPPQLPIFPTAAVNNTLPIHDPYFNYSLPNLTQDFVDYPVPISNFDSYNVTDVAEPAMSVDVIGGDDCSGGFLDFLESDGFMENIDCLFDECGFLGPCDVNAEAAGGDLDGLGMATADQAVFDLDQITQLMSSDSSNYSLPISICF